MGLPVCGIAAGLVILFLKLRTPARSFRDKISRMDWMYVLPSYVCLYHADMLTFASSGNSIVIASSTAVAIALTWGGIKYPWSSVRILVPLILGLCGLALWLLYEHTWATHPIVSQSEVQA